MSGGYGAVARKQLAAHAFTHLRLCYHVRPQMSGGYGPVAKEQLADRVCALFRQHVIRPVP